MRVKLKTNLGSKDYPWAFSTKDAAGNLLDFLEGDVRDVDDKHGRTLVARGHAVEIATPKPPPPAIQPAAEVVAPKASQPPASMVPPAPAAPAETPKSGSKSKGDK